MSLRTNWIDPPTQLEQADHDRTAPTRGRELLRFVLTAAAYALAVWCGRATAVPPDYLPPVWPANPILLTALLLTPTRQWWVYFLIPFALDRIWWSATPYSTPTGLIWSVADSLEVAAIALALRWTGIGIPRFDRLREVGVYLLIAAGAIALAATFAALVWPDLEGDGIWDIWRGWFFADFLSHLTLAPILLTWARGRLATTRDTPPHRRPRRLLEGALLFAGLVVTVFAVFGTHRAPLPGLVYLPLPFLLWATLRFGVPGTYAALTLTAFLATWNLSMGQGLPLPLDPARNMLSIQIFLIATALPMAILSAVLNERQEAQESLIRYTERLAKAKDEAHAANKAKDQFLAVLSHELRTPLTPVLLTASLLESRSDLPEEAYGDIRTIRRCVELEARLIDDLLDITRIARGKLQLRKEVVDVHEAARQAMNLCCREVERVNVNVDLRAEHHHALVDPARLQQVFWNLLNNAFKFTPPGGLVTVRSSNADSVLLRVEVADTGIGIDPAILPRLFKAFEQGDSSLTRKFGGLGLGLAISKSIAELHGGTLTAYSPGTGQGATFTLELPTAPAPAILPRHEPLRTHPRPAVAAARRPLRILLVEDSPETLKVLAAFLRTLGHHVRPAESQQAALAADQQEAFDLVISDLGLPDGDGHALMRQLRQRHAQLRGIALSGYGTEEDIQQSHEAGFECHLTKPVSIEQLESVIEQVAL